MKQAVIILATIFGLVILHSCEEDKDVVLNMDHASAPAITSPAAGASFTLSEEQEDEVVFNLEWEAADYTTEGMPQPRYLLQADLAENNFEDATTIIDITETRTNSFGITGGRLNTLALTRMGISPFETGEISFRIFAFLTRASEHTWMYSQPVTISVTPFEQVIDADILNVPGSYQGWNPGNDNTVVYSLAMDDIYEGYMYFPDDDTEFKYALGDWSTNWGDTGADGNLEPDGANIEASLPGVYKLNVDLNELTHEFLRTEWSMIGDAGPDLGDWDTDIPMEVDTEFYDDTWNTRLTAIVQLGEGEFKFRANADWDLNLGVDNDEVLTYGGANIVVEQAGTYMVILDLSGPLYRYELIPQ